MGAAEKEREQGAGARTASRPAGARGGQLPENRHGSHAAFQLLPPPGRERNRVQRRESPLFTFQLLLGEAAGELTAASAAAARGRQIHVLDGYACCR